MKSDVNYDRSSRLHTVEVIVDDRELAFAGNPRAIIPAVQKEVTDRIADIIMTAIEPLLTKALLNVSEISDGIGPPHAASNHDVLPPNEAFGKKE